jgi:hypothetical protein
VFRFLPSGAIKYYFFEVDVANVGFKSILLKLLKIFRPVEPFRIEEAIDYRDLIDQNCGIFLFLYEIVFSVA